MSSGAVLFMCVANSARSQMAEGLARRHAPAGVAVYSAGSEPAVVNPYAVEAMHEVGIDIESHRSKGIEDVPVDQIETVITLCAEEVCPTFPRQIEKLHWPHPDPAAASGSHEEILASFRTVRDQLEESIRRFFEAR